MQKTPFKKYFRPVVRLMSGREFALEKRLSSLFLTVAIVACCATSASARNASRPMATAVPVQFVAVASSSIAKNAANETPDAASFSSDAQTKSPGAQLNAQNVSQRSSLPPTAPRFVIPRAVASRSKSPRLSGGTNAQSSAFKNAKKPALNAISQARAAEKVAATLPKTTAAMSRETIDGYWNVAQSSSRPNRDSTPKRVSDSQRLQIVDYSQKPITSNAATTKVAQANNVTSSTRSTNTASPSVSAPSVATMGKRVVLLPPDSARSDETADNRAVNVPTISRVQTPPEAVLNRAPLQQVEPKLTQRKPANLSSRARDRFLLAQMEADLRRAQGRLNNASETLSQGQKQLMKVSGTLQQAMLEAGSDAKGLHPFVRVAQRYAGTPYVWGGESRNGFDCSGFIIVVMRDLGYRALPHSAAEQFNYGTPVAKPLLKAGDIVFFKNTYKRGVSHVGIYLGRGRFIHAAGTGTGTIVSSLNEAKWILHYAGARRLVRR